MGFATKQCPLFSSVTSVSLGLTCELEFEVGGGGRWKFKLNHNVNL